jgi:peptide/nickel transport system substrate-binding protein
MRGILRQVGTGVGVALLVLLTGSVAAYQPTPHSQIVIAQSVDPTTLDPHAHDGTPTYNVLLNVYDTLLFRDRDLRLVPWLAESWRRVNSSTWEFKLRDGVKFHNGEELNADAVKWSLDRLRDPKLNTVQAGYFRLVTAVEVVDRLTVRFVTRRPFPTLPNQLAVRGAIMAPRHFQGKDEAFVSRYPAGTGAYRMVRWKRDDQTVLEANDQWWGGPPIIKTLIFRSIPEDSVRVAALQAGELDLAVNIPPHLRPAIENDPRLYVSTAPSARTIFIPIYTHRFDAEHRAVAPIEGPTADRRVRQAILSTVNPDEIIRTVLGGHAVRTASILTSAHFGFDPALKPVEFSVARATALLAEAGYPNGIELTLNSPHGRYLKDKEVAEAIAGQLSKAGIRTSVRTFEWATYGKLVFTHQAGPMFLIGWGNTTWDADASLFPTLRSGNPFANYFSPEFDGLVDEAQVTADNTRRRALYARAQRLVRDDAAVIPLYQQVDLYGVNKRLRFQALSSEQLVGAWMSLHDRR